MSKSTENKPSQIPSASNPYGTIASGPQPWVMVFLLKTGVEEKTFKLHKRRAVIGSALSSDIRLQEGGISNVHAVVELGEKNSVMIYDMASETGVFVNGQRAIAQSLKTGDRIKVGSAELIFSLQAVQETTAALPDRVVQKTGVNRLFLNEQEDFRPLILEDERNVVEIFDYPQQGELALQVAQYWDSVILNICHYGVEQVVSIGDAREAQFVVPGFLSSFPFITFENGECLLSFTDEMDGIVQTKQKLTTLNDLRSEKRAGGGSFRLSLKATDFVKIKLRGITFFVSFTPEPPHLRRQRVLDRDPFFFKIWATSLVLSLFLMVLVANMQVEQKLEVSELPPRVATILFKPVIPSPPVVKRPLVDQQPPTEKFPETTKRPPTEIKQNAKIGKTPQQKSQSVVRDNIQNNRNQQARAGGGDRGEGARARGDEGRKGEANKPKASIGQQKSQGSPDANTTAKSQGVGAGAVESLAGDLSGAISKSLSAGGKGVSAATGRLRGYGGYTTEGSGGLGNVGTGAGGGGESLDVAGLGTKGLGEGSVGKGLGAIGEGGNIVGTSRGRPQIEVGGAQETIVLGGLDRDLIDQYIRKHMNQLRYCYEKEANAGNPELRGRVMTRFVISASGRVSQAGVESSTIQNANVERCVVGVIQRIIFPEPLGGGVVEVSYPFNFSPALRQ